MLTGHLQSAVEALLASAVQVRVRVRVRVIVVIWTRVTTRVISQGDRYETGFQGDRYGIKPDFRDIDMA